MNVYSERFNKFFVLDIIINSFTLKLIFKKLSGNNMESVSFQDLS